MLWKMLASELFEMIEREVPKELALNNDPVGFSGPGDPDEIEVKKAVVVLDLVPKASLGISEVDLIVCHHPPLFCSSIPTYVIHSNWDVVQGGANDALAESLNINVLDIFDEKTGIGRICSTENSLDGFIKDVMESISVDYLRIVKGRKELIEKVVVVSGFGLNPEYIKLAYEKGADLYLSGDLTHPGAVLARKLGISVVDATHHATEVPGLFKLCQLISEFGIIAEFNNPGMPWDTYPYAKI